MVDRRSVFEALDHDMIGILAIDPAGGVSAFCVTPGFTYAVTDAQSATKVLNALSLFSA